MISISILWCARFWWRQWSRWLSWFYYTDSDNEAVLWAALRCCNLFGCWISKEEKEWMNFKDRVSKRDFPPAEWSLLLLWRTLLSCRGWSPRGPLGRLSSDDNTCPYYMYITLMLTCNLSAVAAWRHSLCVCTEVATCEFVQYMQMCVLVSAKKSVCRHAKATRACTLQQLHRTHTLNTHTQTNSSHRSPFFTLSWALPVTPHGDFALCQLSYSNKPLRHWAPGCHYWLQFDWLLLI